MNDPVNPDHYKGSVECIDALIAALGVQGALDYCVGNVIKYSWRHRNKNGLEDLKKAQWYINKAIEIYPEV